MIEVIYLDMDGVLCDFETRYTELFGVTPDKAGKKNWNTYWEKFIGGKHFATLDWHPSGKDLLEGVRKYATNNRVYLEILTSAGGDFMAEEIALQKRDWLKKNDIKHRYLHVVPGKRFKKDFAHGGALLIDDTPKNIVQFREAGGKAIHHTGDAVATLEKLFGGNYES